MTSTDKMHFRRMDEGGDADFDVLAEVHEENLRLLPDHLLGLLDSLGSDDKYPIDRKAHSLQAATRARRDGRDEEYVVGALLHTSVRWGPMNHGKIAAAILEPFVSEGNRWMLAHLGVFQAYFYVSHLGGDPNAREQYRGTPYFDQTAEFCARYDEVSFDPDYDNEPVGTFEPMVRRVLDKPWLPPSASPRSD